MSTLRRGLPSHATPGVRVPSDRSLRRADARPGRTRRSRVWLWRGGALVVLLGLVVGAGYWMVHRVVHAEGVAVDRVTIEGRRRMSAADVEAAAGPLRGQSLLTLDLTALRARLLRSPWIADATVWRTLPSTIGIKIVERTPIALARCNQLLYMVDELGTIVGEFGQGYPGMDLPIVDGIVKTTVEGPRADAPRVQAVAQFLSALDDAPGLRARVSQIDATHAHDLVVWLDGDPTKLHVGDNDFVDRLRRYLELVPTLREQMKAVDYVDLRFDDRLVAQPVRATTPKSKG